MTFPIESGERNGPGLRIGMTDKKKVLFRNLALVNNARRCAVEAQHRALNFSLALRRIVGTYVGHLPIRKLLTDEVAMAIFAKVAVVPLPVGDRALTPSQIWDGYSFLYRHDACHHGQPSVGKPPDVRVPSVRSAARCQDLQASPPVIITTRPVSLPLPSQLFSPRSGTGSILIERPG